MSWFTWSAVKQVVIVESRRQTGEVIQSETRYYLSSLPENAFAFAALTRNYWSIENHLHGMLVVVFHPDQCRTR
jgi:predicted transposase YbfD/YdcC